MRESTSYLTEGPIARPLMKLATPMIVAFSFQTSFNFVDRYFVSRLGDVATAAIGMAFVVQLIFIALGSGMGMGLNSFISRNLGARRKDRAVSAALHSFLLALALGILFGALGLLTQRSIFRLLGAEGRLLGYITEYLTVLFFFAPVYLLSMLSNNIFRGWGDTVYPMKFMITGTALNIVLDPILIFGWAGVPAMGIKGAALATGISRLLAFLYSLYVLVVKGKPERLKMPRFRFDWGIIRGIFQVGFPASIGQILTSLTLSLIFVILRSYGDSARAAYTIAFTYEMVAFLPVIGIGQAIAIMTGHNYGAKKYHRIQQIYYTGLKIALGMMLAVSLVVSAAPDTFAGVFARSPEVRHLTAQTLRILAFGYIFNGVFMCTVTSFQGLGLGSYQLIATLIKMFALMLPLAYLGSLLWGVLGVWGGILTANILMAIILFSWFQYMYHRQLLRGKIVTL